MSRLDRIIAFVTAQSTGPAASPPAPELDRMQDRMQDQLRGVRADPLPPADPVLRPGWRRRALLRAAPLVLLALVLGLALGGNAIMLTALAGIAAFAAGTIALLYERDTADAELAMSRQRDQQVEAARRSAADAEVMRLIDGLGDPALVIDGRNIIRQANAAARAVFGANLGGQNVELFLRAPGVSDIIRAARAAGQSQQGQVNLTTPVERSYVMHVARLDVAAGTLLTVLRDVTALRLTERMRADFVANASHELRTPLSTVLGFIETLQGPAADDAAARARFLGIMAQEANRMTRLIDDLLSLSRIELGKQAQPSESLDLVPLLQSLGTTLTLRLDHDDREIRLDIEPDLPHVLADRDQILQVMHNLLSNAIKYGRKGTPISISASTARRQPGSADRWVRIAVRDRGDGIAPEHLPRLTERFYRIDTARSRQMGGTGLGLAIVKHIVERHRGRIEIESALGEGTTIAFTLPTAAPAQPAAADGRGPLPGPASGLFLDVTKVQ